MPNGIGRAAPFAQNAADIQELHSSQNYSPVDALSKVSNPQPLMSSPAQNSRLKQIHVADNHLDNWVNAAPNAQERGWRANLADELKQNPIHIREDGMHIEGNVSLSSLSKITSLPDHLIFDGDLNIMHMPNLEKLPDNLVVKGNLELHECGQLKSLGQYLDVQGALVINQCHQLLTLPSLMNVGQDLHLIDNLRLRELPMGLMVNGNLYISDCQQLGSLPEGLRVNGDAKVELCPQLTHLPDYMNIKGNMSFKYCIMLHSMPENMKVNGSLELDHCLSLAELPNGLEVKGSLEAKSCLMLAKIPDNLKVGEHLTMTHAAIQEFPQQPLIIGGHIDLTGCASLRQVPEWFHTLPAINDGSSEIGRRINLINTGLSLESIADLSSLHLPNVSYRVDSDGEGARTSKAIVTKHGSEAEDILKVLRKKPNQSLFIRYQDNVGIDQGGLSRQAFAQAYKQLLTNEKGLFTAGKLGFFELKPQAFKEQKQLLRDLGLILSRTGILKMGLGYGMQPEILNKTHAAWLASDAQNPLHEEAVDQLQQDELIKVLSIVDAELQDNEANADYLKEMPLDELRGYVKETALPYFTLANAMRDGGMNVDTNPKAFIETICGPEKLTKFFMENLKIRTLPNVDEEDHEFVEQLKKDLQTIVAKATTEELKPLCEAMTGSAYLSPHAPDLTFNITGETEKSDALVHAHTCARAIDINASAYKTIPETERFNLLKSFMLSTDLKFDAA